MRFLSSALLITLLLLLTGCNAIPGGNSGGILNKKQVLKLNPDAQPNTLNLTIAFM